MNRGKSQEASPEFDRVLKNAVDRRVAFTSYVSETIVGDDGEKSITVTVATAVALFPLLRKAGKTI